MRLKTVYIVTRPTPVSTLEDILFPADLPRLELQFRGGLTASEIYGAYTDPKEARAVALMILKLENPTP